MTTTVFRIDDREFSELADAIDYVSTTYFPEANEVTYEREPDREGYHWDFFDEDDDSDELFVVTVFEIVS